MRAAREPGSAWALSSSIVRTEKVISSGLKAPPDAARRAKRPTVTALGLATGAMAAAAAGACAGALSTSMPSPTTLHGAWPWMS